MKPLHCHWCDHLANLQNYNYFYSTWSWMGKAKIKGTWPSNLVVVICRLREIIGEILSYNNSAPSNSTTEIKLLCTHTEHCYIFFAEGLDSFPVKPSIIVGLSSESKGCLPGKPRASWGGLAEVFINQQPHPSLYVLVKSSGFHISNRGFPKCNDK